MNKRILVLDDQPELRETYCEILRPLEPPQIIVSSRNLASTKVQKIDFDVTCASSGEEALTLILKGLEEGKPFAGGFFDVKLGAGIDGIETLRQVKDLDHDLLCVIVSAYQDRSLEEIRHVVGIDFSDRWDYLEKPFSRTEILQKAFNLTSNWNRKIREREHLQHLRVREEEEEALRLVFQDALKRIKDSAGTVTLESLSLETRVCLQSILKTTAECEKVIEQVIDTVKRRVKS